MKTKITAYILETNTLIGKVEFTESGIFVDVLRNDEDREQVCHLYLQSSEELDNLAQIIQKLNDFNLQ
jgi:hypothetical protein